LGNIKAAKKKQRAKAKRWKKFASRIGVRKPDRGV